MDSNCGDLAVLPEELVIEIFKLLDTRSLIQVTKTCKFCKAIVENFIGWKQVTISAETTEDYGNFSSLTRSTPALKICGDFTIGSRFLNLTNFLRQVGAEFTKEVKILEFKSMTIRVKILASILRLLPNLKEVKLLSVKSPADDADTELSDIEIPTLEKLKKLIFIAESSSVLLSCFAKARISTFEAVKQTFDAQAISRFLANQPELTDLELCRLATHQFCLTSVEPQNIPFRLKRLAVDYVDMRDYDRIIQLIALQVTSLETLEVGHFPGGFYQLFFCPELKIKTLHLIPGCMAQNSVIMPSTTNERITSLRLYSGTRYGLDEAKIKVTAIQVIQKLPNLENLELLIPFDQSFQDTIFESSRKLKSLTISLPFFTNINQLKLPNTIEKLRIKCITCRPALVHGTNQPHPNLKSMIFEGVVNEVFLSTISRKFPNLESLEVRRVLDRVDRESSNEKSDPYERNPASIIKGVKYREDDFFIQKFRF